MTSKSFLTILIAFASLYSQASELLVVGYIDKVSIQSFEKGQCTKPCPELSTTTAKGEQRICISNHCGCQETEVVVDRVIVGEYSAKALHVHDLLGEWCTASQRPSFHPVLLYVDGKRSYFTPLERREDGEEYFDPVRIDSISGKAMSALPLHSGKVRLSDLLKALPTAQ